MQNELHAVHDTAVDQVRADSNFDMAGDNKYRCDKCASLVDAKRGLRLSQLPPILTLSLSRFTYSVEGREKITKAFPFPMKLHVGHGRFAAGACSGHPTPHVHTTPPEIEYELFSVIVVRRFARTPSDVSYICYMYVCMRVCVYIYIYIYIYIYSHTHTHSHNNR